MKSGFLNRLMERADKVDKEQIVDYMVEIAQERDLMVLIFDSMIEGMIVTDDRENVVLINQSARSILDLGDGPTAPLIPLHKIIDNKKLLMICEKGTASNDPLLEQEYEIEMEGEHRYLEVNTIPLHNRGVRHGTLFLFIDETESKEQERRLREAEKLAALTTMSAGVSHEIRNPLNSLSIHLQLLKRYIKKNGIDDEDINETLGIFENEIKRLNDVIETFLTAVRPSQPQLKLQPLNKLVTDTLSLLEPEFRENEIRVSLREEESWPLIKADETQFKQAFINILRNAIEAIVEHDEQSEQPIKRDMVIRMARKPDAVTLAVADTGKGIEPSDLPHIFEPYFTKKSRGTGLGLMIVDRIIREHGGELEAHSELGKGTQIVMTLPVAGEQPRLLNEGKEHPNE